MKTHASRVTSQRWFARTHMVAVAAAAVLFSASLAVWAAGKKAKEAVAESTDEAGKTADEDLPPAKPDTVRVYIQTSPPRKAQVKWGGKLLGTIPVPRALVV